MRNTLLVMAVVALLPDPSVAAEQPRPQKPEKSISAGRPLPLNRAATGNSCATYGAGFVKVEGTETCMKIGGAVSVGVGGSR